MYTYTYIYKITVTSEEIKTSDWILHLIQSIVSTRMLFIILWEAKNRVDIPLPLRVYNLEQRRHIQGKENKTLVQLIKK